MAPSNVANFLQFHGIPLARLNAVCGIAGIVSTDALHEDDVARALRMRDVLTHRGPDGAGLYSDTGLQVVYLLLSVYGWYAWVRGGPSNAALTVTRIPRRTAFAVAALAVTTWVLLWIVTSRIPGVALAPLDAALVAASLAAQFMMTRKYRECWLVWIVTDIAYVAMFMFKGLALTAVLYAIFTALAIKGHRDWTRSFVRTSRA